MFSKVFILIVFALCLRAIVCEESAQDLCSELKPNGKYTGLGWYHYYEKGKDIGTYKLWNRVGKRWPLEIDFSSEPFTIKAGKNESDRTYENLILRWSFYLKERSPTTLKGNVFYSAVYKDATNSNGFLTKTFIDENWNNDIIKDNTTKFSSSAVFKFKTHEGMEVMDGAKFYVYDKTNKKNFFVYKPLETKDRTQDCSKTTCDPLNFINDMDDSLFAQIEEVMHLDGKDSKKSGHLVLFNVDGRPMFCFIPQIDAHSNKYSAEECKTKDDLTNLFGECFPTSAPPPPPKGGPAGPGTKTDSPIETTAKTGSASVALTVSLSAFAIPLILVVFRF